MSSVLFIITFDEFVNIETVAIFHLKFFDLYNSLYIYWIQNFEEASRFYIMIGICSWIQKNRLI